MVNPSTTTAHLIVEELLAFGAKHVVLAPGSRSAPLAFAFAQAANAGMIQLHVRIDERDAGFLALGLAKSSQTIVPILVTSGTAVANLMPAVIEAYHSAVPLVVLSADRPASARGKSAPQIIEQEHLFGHFVKDAVDLVPQVTNIDPVTKALTTALTTHQGPVQINVQFDVPLVPESADLDWKPEFTQSVELSNLNAEVVPAVDDEVVELPSHGVVIAGDLTKQLDSKQAQKLAQELGWPIIWEPSANVHDAANSVSHGVLLLTNENAPQPEAVVTVGTVGLSRPVLQLLNKVSTHVAIHCQGQGPDIPDPAQSGPRIIRGFPKVTTEVDTSWLPMWQILDAQVSEIVADELRLDTVNGPAACNLVWNHAPDGSQLLVAASWPVRHLEAYAPKRSGLRVYGNRGVNGIDGLISTAWGVASTSTERTYLLIGDIAFLHDIGGLNVADGEVHPSLTIVVLDNDGGGIFSQLEQGAQEYQQYFEKVFGTPHGKDLWQIAESFGYPATRVTTCSELESALQKTDNIPGVHVIVCMTGTRSDEVSLIRSIAQRVATL